MNTRKIKKPLPCFLTLPLSFPFSLFPFPPLLSPFFLPCMLVTPGLYRVVVVPAC